MRPVRVVTILVLAVLVASLVPEAAGAGARRPPRRARFESPAGGSLLVHGTYPRIKSSCVGAEQPLLHERYRGAVEVGVDSDGSLTLVGELPFEDYLKGIAEVPRDWPQDALQAQVVAARTFARSQLNGSSAGGLPYDLCATDACQVYMGMGVEAGAWGERWVRAVDQTAGEILRHRGEPAQTFYFSTSNGRTYSNRQVWGGTAIPYLKGIRERDDDDSPLSRWEVRLPFGDLARFLRAEGLWRKGPIRSVNVDGGRMRFRGKRNVTLLRGELRDALNSTASCLEPGDYPTREPDGYRLPQAVPSIWYRAQQQGNSLVLEGRGWGHGIGMVQWGAYGKAKRGLSYREILSAYYGGLRPRETRGPGTIRILLAEDLRSVTIVPSDDRRARVLGKSREPPWEITGGRRIRVGRGGTPDPVLKVERFRARTHDGTIKATFDSSNSVNARLRFLQDDDVVATTDSRPSEEGPVKLREPIPDLEPGTYDVEATITDGVDTIVTPAREVELAASPVAGPTASPTPRVLAEPASDDDGSFLPWIVGAVAAILAALGIGLTLRRRTRLHRD